MAGFVAAAVVSTAYSVYKGQEARKEQKKANKKAARIEAVRGQQERAQALRQNRIRAADVFAMGANAGVQGSSGVQGALGALGTNQAVNFGFANQIDSLNASRLKALSAAGSAENLSQLGQTAAGLSLKLDERFLGA